MNTVTTSLHNTMTSTCLFAIVAATYAILRLLVVDCLMKIGRDFCPGVACETR